MNAEGRGRPGFIGRLAGGALAATLCCVPCAAQNQSLPTPEEMKRSFDQLRYTLNTWGSPRHPAAPFTPAPDSENAAARYAWLFERMDERLEVLADWHDVQADALAVFENEDGLTAEELERCLVRESEWIRQVVAATSLERFELGLADNPRAEFESREDVRWTVISGARHAGQILIADATRLWHKGERDAAVERLAASIRLAGHCAAPPYMGLQPQIAAYVLRNACESAQRLTSDAERLAPAQREVLLRAVNRLQRDDPAGLHRWWIGQVNCFSRYIREQVKDGRVGAGLRRLLVRDRAIMETVRGMFGGLRAGGDVPGSRRASARQRLQRLWGDAEEIDGITTASVVEALGVAEALAARATRAWGTPEADDTLTEVQAAVEQDETGIVRIVVSYPRTLHRNWRELVDAVAELRRALERESGLQ